MSIEFSKGVVGPGGSLEITKIRTLMRSSIQKCPHYIMAPDHYRDDETCRCDDEGHTEMAEWGYVWNSKAWN